MNITQIVGAAICMSLLALIVKGIKSETGHMVSIAAAIVIMAAVIPYAIKIVDAVKELAAYSSMGERYIKPILKITGIAYITQIGRELCEENGEKAMGARVLGAGKIAIAAVTLPIAKEAFFKIMEILT